MQLQTQSYYRSTATIKPISHSPAVIISNILTKAYFSSSYLAQAEWIQIIYHINVKKTLKTIQHKDKQLAATYKTYF